MNLGHSVAAEAGVHPEEVLLLRHGNAKTRAVRAAGGTLEEYTLVQPTDTKYDFLARGKPPISVVVAIVDDRVHAVYRILGVEEEGTTWSLTSPGFNKFDKEAGYPELPAKRFRAESIASQVLRRRVVDWANPRLAVARYGSKTFESVSVL